MPYKNNFYDYIYEGYDEPQETDLGCQGARPSFLLYLVYGGVLLKKYHKPHIENLK